MVAKLMSALKLWPLALVFALIAGMLVFAFRDNRDGYYDWRMKVAPRWMVLRGDHAIRVNTTVENYGTFPNGAYCWVSAWSKRWSGSGWLSSSLTTIYDVGIRRPVKLTFVIPTGKEPAGDATYFAGTCVS